MRLPCRPDFSRLQSRGKRLAYLTAPFGLAGSFPGGPTVVSSPRPAAFIASHAKSYPKAHGIG
jgi:hypothetical protein